MMYSLRIIAVLTLFLGAARLEHSEHPIRDREPAHDVAHGGDDCNSAKYRRERALALTDKDDRSDNGDCVQRVGQRHEWCMKQRRDPANHLEADERGQHEYVKACDHINVHWPSLLASVGIAGSAKNSRTRALTTLPPWVSSVSRMISSFRSS